MESHSCEKNRGEGVLPPASFPELSDVADDPLRCRHIDALGRRCRMFVATPQASSSNLPDPLPDQAAELCPHHAHLLLRRHRVREATAAELLASVSDFNDPASVNRFLGNLLKLVALKRIPRRDGIALAYISQLMLNSQAAQDRRELVRLKIAELDEKNTPTRVIWDLPMSRSAEIRKAVEEESKRDERQRGEEASAGKAAPPQAPLPPSVPAPSAQCDDQPSAPAPAPAAPVQPPLRDCRPAQSVSAMPPSKPTAPQPGTPASSYGVKPAPPSAPKSAPAVSQPSGQDIDDIDDCPMISLAKPAWAKPVRKHYGY